LDCYIGFGGLLVIWLSFCYLSYRECLVDGLGVIFDGFVVGHVGFNNVLLVTSIIWTLVSFVLICGWLVYWYLLCIWYSSGTHKNSRYKKLTLGCW